VESLFTKGLHLPEDLSFQWVASIAQAVVQSVQSGLESLLQAVSGHFSTGFSAPVVETPW
jgi:hypothetical protein